MIALIIMNAVIFCSAFLLTRRVFRIKRLLDSWLAFMLIYFTQIIASLTALGLAGALYLENVIILNLLILALIWFFCRNNKTTLIFPRGMAEKVKSTLKNKVVLACVAAIAAFGLSKLSVNLYNPPFGWDSLNYHFTFAVEWLKHGNLIVPPTVFDDPSPSYYPINGSLVYLWLMLPLRSVFLADLGQVPFFALAFFSVYGIARKLGLGREHSFYSTVLFLLIPNFFKQLQVAYVDVMVAGLFLASVYFLFLLNEDYSWQNTLLFAAGLGLLLGTKTVAFPYALILSVPFIYFSLRNYRKIHLIFPALITVAALGGFSYIRNFIETGNPLYPLNLVLFGKTVLRGVMDKAIYKVHFRPEDYSLSKMLFHEGLGFQTLLFILPAFFLGLPVAIFKKRKQMDFFLVYFFLIPLMIYLVYYYVIPLANLRYLYPLLGLGMAIGFFIASNLRVSNIAIRAGVIICLLASIGELAKRQELVASIILCVVFFFLIPEILKVIGRVAARKRLAAITAAILLLALLLLNNNYNAHEYPRYAKMKKYSGFWPEAINAWIWLDANTFKDNIAYAGRPVPFPLYGTNFKNNVYYVSVNKTDPARLHYFPHSFYKWEDDFLSVHKSFENRGNYRSEADYSVWLGNLRKRAIDYLFVYSLHQTKEIVFPMEDTWAKSNPGSFTLVFNKATVHIYRLVK